MRDARADARTLGCGGYFADTRCRVDSLLGRGGPVQQVCHYGEFSLDVQRRQRSDVLGCLLSQDWSRSGGEIRKLPGFPEKRNPQVYKLRDDFTCRSE